MFVKYNLYKEFVVDSIHRKILSTRLCTLSFIEFCHEQVNNSIGDNIDIESTYYFSRNNIEYVFFRYVLLENELQI